MLLLQKGDGAILSIRSTTSGALCLLPCVYGHCHSCLLPIATDTLSSDRLSQPETTDHSQTVATYSSKLIRSLCVSRIESRTFNRRRTLLRAAAMTDTADSASALPAVSSLVNGDIRVLYPHISVYVRISLYIYKNTDKLAPVPMEEHEEGHSQDQGPDSACDFTETSSSEPQGGDENEEHHEESSDTTLVAEDKKEGSSEEGPTTSSADEQVEGESAGGTSEQAQEPGCIFCRIAKGQTDTELLHSDDDFVCFQDHRPQATHHYLVVSKAHIPSLKHLNSDHVPTIKRMAEIGKEVLCKQNGNLDDYRAGFHWPPFLMVQHLHLHVLAPESQLGFINRHIVFRKDSWVFTTAEASIEYLRSKTT